MTLRILFRLLCLLCCLWASVASGQTIIGKTVPNIHPEIFTNELCKVQIIVLNSEKLLEFAQKGDLIRLKPSAQQDWLIQLTPDPIFTPDYELNVATEKGVSPMLSSRVQTFSGVIRGSASGTCRLTLSEGFIYGVFELEEQTYFIEPARRFNQTFGEDQYLFYESGDILPNPNGRCAGAVFSGKSEVITELEKSAGQCYTVRVAIAADYKMYQLYNNDLALLEKYVAAILNSVRANYDNEFAHEIRFEISKIWVSTCPTCDPWGEDTNYENLLSNFRDWGNENGFNAAFDVATFWTGRVLDDNIGGGGYYGVLCGRLRYNLLRRYSENAGLMRALQAHELGHNLNARHDATNDPTIMAPLIRDVQAWSSNSVVGINNYFNIALGLPDCIKGCQETAPTADFFVLKSKGCRPLTVQFYNTSSANTTQWEWTFPGGNPATATTVNPLVTYAQPGIYSVTLRSKSVGGENEIVKTALVEVKGPPSPTFTIDYQPGVTNATFTTNVVADSIRWNWGNGNTSKEPTVSFDFQVDGSYPISLTAYNECGINTVAQVLNIITPPQAGFSAANFIGCAPLTVQLNNESSANAVEFAWQFTGGTPATSTEKNPKILYEKPGVYSITLVARNAAGEVTRRLNNLVQVNDVPNAGFSITTKNNEITFRNLSQSATTYQWTFGDGNNSAETNPIHTYATSGMFNVQLIAQNECGSDTTVKMVEIIGLPPVAAFAVNAQEGCIPLTVTFNDQSTNEPEAWEWHFPGGKPNFSLEQHPIVQYNNPGTYPVELITTNFFGKDTLVFDHFITVSEAPVADYTWVIEEREVAFHLSDVVQRGWEYEWHFGDGNTSLQTEPTHEYENPGTYAVELIVSNDCGRDTIRKTLQIGSTATKETAWLKVFQLYPNPHAGHFYISLVGEPQKRLRLRTINALGQEMQRQEVDFSGGNLLHYFDFQYLANGVYWLEIQNETSILKKSFIVQKP